MKTHLDAKQAATEGWTRVRSAREVVAGGMTHLAHDHDQGKAAAYGTDHAVLFRLEARR